MQKLILHTFSFKEYFAGSFHFYLGNDEAGKITLSLPNAFTVYANIF